MENPHDIPEDTSIEEISQDSKYSKIQLLNMIMFETARARMHRQPNFIDCVEQLHDFLQNKQNIEYTSWLVNEKEKIRKCMAKIHPAKKQEIEQVLNWQLHEKMFGKLNALTQNVEIMDSTRKWRK